MSLAGLAEDRKVRNLVKKVKNPWSILLYHDNSSVSYFNFINLQVLMDMFQQDEDGDISGVVEEPNLDTSITYDELVKDLIQEKKTYLRELNMIIKVICYMLASNVLLLF